MSRRWIGYGLLFGMAAIPALLVACQEHPDEPARIDESAIVGLEEEELCTDEEVDASAPTPEPTPPPVTTVMDSGIYTDVPTPPASAGLGESNLPSPNASPSGVKVQGPIPKPPGTPPKPPPKPPPPPPKPKVCKCDPPNVKAASAAACPANQDVDRTDTANCTAVAPPGNYTAPDGTTWQCGPSVPHFPCVPSAKNGGNATHTHHDRIEYHFANGCCFKKLKKDIKPTTCASPP